MFMVAYLRSRIDRKAGRYCGQGDRVKSSGSTRRNEPWRDEGALRSMVKEMVQSNLIDAKAAASTPVTAYYDNRYVEEVKRSGFFEQLWK
jgi:hypothetical protein